jgi:hypothetical protein
MSLSNGEMTSRPPKLPWNGFFIGGLLGGKLIGGKGSLTTTVNNADNSFQKDDILFPLPSHTLMLGFNSQFAENSTMSFECDFEYGVLPSLRLAYGYLITPLDRISLGIGLDALLFSLALSNKKDLEVSSLFGFTPSISYERSIGNGAFFQARLSYNYLSIKGENLSKDFKFPEPVKRFVRDYWDKEVQTVKNIDGSIHGVTLSLGFGYTF